MGQVTSFPFFVVFSNHFQSFVLFKKVVLAIISIKIQNLFIKTMRKLASMSHGNVTSRATLLNQLIVNK